MISPGSIPTDALGSFTPRTYFGFSAAADEFRTDEDDPKEASPLIEAKRRGRVESGNGDLDDKPWSEWRLLDTEAVPLGCAIASVQLTH